MTPEQFCYWLQGFVELNGRLPNEAEWQSIKDHLAVVFRKVTPPTYPDAPPYTAPQSPYGGPEIIC
jgi:hypothetical protein